MLDRSFLRFILCITLSVGSVTADRPAARLKGGDAAKAAQSAKNSVIDPKKSNIQTLNQVDHVSMTKEAADLRSHHLTKKKPILRKEADVASLLFPGVKPDEYEEGDKIPMNVELVESKKTQVPFDYYKLPVCRKPGKSEMDDLDNEIKRKNLGQRLTGYSTQTLGYTIETKKDKTCTPLCRVMIESNALKFLRRLVKNKYRAHFTLDGLPILMRSADHNFAVRGYPLGFVGPAPGQSSADSDLEEMYLYNHLRFTIYYNEKDVDNSDAVRITGFDVHPVSIAHSMPEGGWKDVSLKDTPNLDTCQGTVLNQVDTYLPLRTGKAGEDFSVVYSYEVEWKHSEVTWADRWDIYLMETPDNEIHYFAIVNALMIALLLTGAVAVIMIRSLKKDIAQYNDLDDLSSPAEESGWKLCHGDVFRRPKGRVLLSVAVGTACQIGCSVFLTLLCAMFRFLNPMRKGQTLTAVVFLFALSGSVAGYASSRLYKFFSGRAWKRTTILTAIAFPGILVTIFMFLNFFLAYHNAATAVSFWTIVNIFILWMCVSTPLVFLGSYFGYLAEKITVPTKTNQLARFIPVTQSWFVKLPHSALLGGILPFASVCIELYFIMGALWLNQIYYIMGFVMMVCLILTLSCSTVSIVITYCQLCSEDYKWWWKSFINCASAGFYLFLYSLWFLATKMDLVGILPLMVYLSYMGLICFTFSLYCGGVGLIASFWFTRKIYGSVKVD